MNINLVEWQRIISSKILRIGYYQSELYVEYINLKNPYINNHKIYVFKDVPKYIFESIMNKDCISNSKNLPSYGATLYEMVEKNGQYDHYIINSNN